MDTANQTRSLEKDIEMHAEYYRKKKNLSDNEVDLLKQDASLDEPNSRLGRLVRKMALTETTRWGLFEDDTYDDYMRYIEYRYECIEDDRAQQREWRSRRRYEKLKSIGTTILIIVIFLTVVILTQGGGETWFTK